MRNRKSRVESRESRARRRSHARRGVLLIVVLSMLVLFMLIGTAFIMTSNQSRIAAKDAAKQERLGNFATKLLDRGLLHLLRDSENQNSAIRTHSLLRDLYGTDGFQGVIYPADLTNNENGYLVRYAGAIAGTSAQQLGPTNGQFVDIYVSQKGYATFEDSSAAPPIPVNYVGGYNATDPNYALDLRNVLKLDRNVVGQPQPYPLPLTKGYFNGCLLTITSGPAAGQSTRILDYENIPTNNDPNFPSAKPGKPAMSATLLFHFRVMAFGRKDGQLLAVDQVLPTNKGRMPELTELAGQSFMVNGRAYSGTGVGYNPLAAAGQQRLSALQLFPVDSTPHFIGAELALLPNAMYFNPRGTTILTGAAPPTIADPSSRGPHSVRAIHDAASARAVDAGRFFSKAQ